MIELIEEKIKQDISNLRCQDLYQMKEDFYSKVSNLLGGTSNFTGITELIVYRSIYHLFGFSGNPQNESVTQGELELFSGKSFPAKRGRSQVPDISICKNRKLELVFSVKNSVGTAGKDAKDENSQVIKKILGSDYSNLPVLAQDISRLENFRFEKHKAFRSFTIIFEQLEQRNF